VKTLSVSKEISGAPPEFQLLPQGMIEIEGEDPVFLDVEGMNQIISDFERRGNDMVIDYEHQTLKDVQAPAAGWIKKLLNRGAQGLWAAVEWTEKAKGYLAKREYRYYSPVFNARKSDRRVVQMINAALTNSPKINHLRAIVAKQFFAEIDEAQRKLNEMMGISDEDFLEYSCKAPDFRSPLISDEQRKINKTMGISDEDFLKYSCKDNVSEPDESDEEKIQRLLGLKR